ncbi:hypothetical protein KEM52_006250, partial [Ascosphaera acerosa]
PAYPQPAFFATSLRLDGRPMNAVKSGLKKMDRVASKAALKGIDAGVAATKKTKKSMGINGRSKKQTGATGMTGKRDNGGGKTGGNQARR